MKLSQAPLSLETSRRLAATSWSMSGLWPSVPMKIAVLPAGAAATAERWPVTVSMSSDRSWAA